MERGKEDSQAQGVDLRAPPPPYEAISFSDNSGYVPDICPQPSSASQTPNAYPFLERPQALPPNYYPGCPASALYPPRNPPGTNVVGSLPPYLPGHPVPPEAYRIVGMSGSVNPTYVYVQPTPLTNPPNDYMGYSLFVTLCCCWILGFLAISRSAECRRAIRSGNRDEAELRSKEAVRLANMALCFGIVFIIVAVIIGLSYGMVMFSY